MTNVIDILTDRDIKYKESSRDYTIVCLNPEHEDSNPSLNIDKVTGIFHCFSCGFKGSIFSHFGAEPNYTEIEIAKLQNKIRSMLSSVTLDMPYDAVPFEQDYRNISKEIYRLAGAFQSQDREEFKDRLIFPIRDIRGNIKGFVGRAIHSELEDKYLYYPAHTVPQLFPARPEIYKNSIIIVEGIFDVLNMMDKGCFNVVCAFGVSTLKKNCKDRLSHYKILGVNKFFIMFDGDNAGRKGQDELKDIMIASGFNAETIELPEGMDPGDLTEQEVSTIMKGLYK